MTDSRLQRVVQPESAPSPIGSPGSTVSFCHLFRRLVMNLREAVETGVAGLATSLLAGYHVAHAAEAKPYRVGLIGCGRFGKNDLFRLIQVAPVEVVSLCDPDQHMVDGAAQMVAKRQKSK